MDLSNLKPQKGAVKKRKRIARGEGSGKGGTATRGHKGQMSRSGSKRRRGFEGGQMPLARRLPKFGFKNRNRKEFKGINVGLLQEISERKNIQNFEHNTFIELGLINKNELYKILGNGELKAKIDVQAHSFSKSAVEAIEKTGGVATII